MTPARHPTSRRFALALLASAGLALTTGAHAAPPTVEIVAFAHPPVVSALKPLREWLASQGGKVRLTETDLESPAGARHLQAAGVTGHVPLVILVNGRYEHRRADGSAVALVSFPVASGTKGWTLDDAKAIITRASQP